MCCFFHPKQSAVNFYHQVTLSKKGWYRCISPSRPIKWTHPLIVYAETDPVLPLNTLFYHFITNLFQFYYKSEALNTWFYILHIYIYVCVCVYTHEHIYTQWTINLYMYIYVYKYTHTSVYTYYRHYISIYYDAAASCFCHTVWCIRMHLIWFFRG